MSFWGKKSKKSITENVPDITIYKNELEYISNCVQEYQDIETGGDLFGFWTHLGYPNIQYVLGAGPNARRNSTSFYQDKEYLVYVGNLLIKEYGLQHIGEWHSHHKLTLNYPSSGDEKTMISAIKNYNLERFLLIICNIEENCVIPNGYLFTSEKVSSYYPCKWKVINNDSPIRNDFDARYMNHIYQPKNSNSYINLNLEKQTYEHSDKLNISKDSWISTKKGIELFRVFIESLKDYVNDLKIFQNDDGFIYIKINYDSYDFYVTFPNDFPNSKPLIEFINGDNSKIINELYSWDSKQNPVEYILDCIKTYSKNEPIIIQIR